MKNARRVVLPVAMVVVFITLLLQVSTATGSASPRIAGLPYDELAGAGESQPATVVRRGNSHPHMNNLVFGRRSSPSSSLWKTEDQLQQVQDGDDGATWRMATAAVRREVQSVCQSMATSCARWQYLHQQLTTTDVGDE